MCCNSKGSLCAVVSLKPGHMDWVRDFDFTLNLFSLPTPWNYYLFLRRIPYRSLWSYPRNRPLVNSRERQVLQPQLWHKYSGTVHVLIEVRGVYKVRTCSSMKKSLWTKRLCCTGSSKKMDGIWNRYNLKSTRRIYTFGVLKCSEKFTVLALP